jgi:hypothetical protein
MPTLVTPKLRFLHVPKTGGVWVTGALAAAGVATAPLARSQNGMVPAHAGLEATADYDRLFTLAYIRHPLDWWRSFWGHRMVHGWEPAHAIDSRARSDDFHEFIALVVERLPGHLHERFSLYIGPPERPISYIGRFERLVEDLVRALHQAGEPFDEAALRSHPRENVGDYARHPARYTPALADALARSELALIERFYAEEPIPSALVA